MATAWILIGCAIYVLLLRLFLKWLYRRKPRELKEIYQICFPGTIRLQSKESLCILTECEKCGTKFLSSIEKAPDKLPARCSVCGNNLVWGVPYTRIEVETKDGIVLEGRNLIHKNGWIEDMQRYVLRHLDDDGIESVKVLIRKKEGR